MVLFHFQRRMACLASRPVFSQRITPKASNSARMFSFQPLSKHSDSSIALAVSLRQPFRMVSPLQIRSFAQMPMPNDPIHLYHEMFGDDDKNDIEGDVDIGKNTLQALRRYTKMRKAGQDLKLGPEVANQILGIVLEDASALSGTSVVAAYYDGTCKFFNGKQYHIGASADDEYLEKLVINFFHFATKHAGQVSKYVKDGERDGPTKNGTVRISLLTPSGIRQAEFTTYQDVFQVVTAGADLGLYMIMST